MKYTLYNDDCIKILESIKDKDYFDIAKSRIETT